ncbi:hypothetical protein M3650_03395 [Paenibacillus sp. MER TA 81-3]|uniref:hypothetical protein n=1 Tax=Paenibacillus sp. MER TA 81-3 TaxID=2939573 RepID=UPI00203C3C74|nr:hypothetical protein [Paenibacillus sp. MER TA 81-3]MCM3337708.1 hypothetical protein [Paenibacillus sp. MER TA 81-3]
MSKLDRFKAELSKYGLDEIDEIDVEYEDGSTSKYSYEDLLDSGIDVEKESSYNDWISTVDWDEVEELKLELISGQKFEFNLEEQEDGDDDDKEDEDDESYSNDDGDEVEEDDDEEDYN